MPNNSLKEHLRNDRGGAKDLKAKVPVCFRKQWVVDTAQYFFDVEDLFCDLARHNVAIIKIGDGNESMSRFDASTLEDVFIDAIANDSLTLKAMLKAVESITAPIDDGDCMPFTIQPARQGRTDTTGAKDHDIHKEPPISQGDRHFSKRRSRSLNDFFERLPFHCSPSHKKMLYAKAFHPLIS